MARFPPLFDFENFVIVADGIVKQNLNPNDEAQLRVAISSAYFGALGAAKQHLTQKHSYHLQRGPNIYTQVRNAFAAFPDAGHQNLVYILEQLRDLEMTANYEDIHPNPVGQARAAVAYAMVLQQQLDSIP